MELISREQPVARKCEPIRFRGTPETISQLRRDCLLPSSSLPSVTFSSDDRERYLLEFGVTDPNQLSDTDRDELWSKGITPFSLGPVYRYCYIDWDITERFVGDVELGKVSGVIMPIKSDVIHFDFPITLQTGDWDSTLSIMENKVYSALKSWFIGCSFFHRDTMTYYEVRLYTVPIMDPFAQLGGKLRPTTLDVWCPTSNKWHMTPKVIAVGNPSKAPLFVSFTKQAPEERVIKAAHAVFSTLIK